MTALTTRMMKIIAARRLVTDASLEPPSSDFTRARMPAGEVVADWLSIAATAGASSEVPRRACGHRPIYQRIVKNGLGGRAARPAVVPGHAKHEPGTHNHGALLWARRGPSFRKTTSCGYGSRARAARGPGITLRVNLDSH